MRRTYRDEVSEESRKMIREYIKFDGRKPSEPGMCRSYEVPFMDGTDLKLGIRSGFYDATITKKHSRGKGSIIHDLWMQG